MRKIEIVNGGRSLPIIVEESAGNGIRKIAEKSAGDIESVTGVRPRILTETGGEEAVILYAIAGKSALLDKMEKEGRFSCEEIRQKREVYSLCIVEEPWEGTKKALVIAGSEKRGAFYGIFHLSEIFGVSPLVFWGDVAPKKQESLVVTEEEEIVSKEPSVRYRGFFINDEWPCFGNWTMEHFGGFNAKMYDHVFELLLRLKGNYLWPAMWTSSFALDGPGEESAALADELGIIMGNSHHEPCLRASEEWDIYKGSDTSYGTAWNYVTNKEGLLNYWRDGLIRSSKYENIVTVGMRGERDSMMEGTTTLADNIEVLKDIIREQEKLIAKYADTEQKKMPRLLAVYKEVERYYYGNAETEGLRNWEGLEDIILMLCEDNFGYMRRLPEEDMQKHKGGFGMYYHLDYHGSPVSYEWINSTPLTKVWEEMTKAYEYGVKEVWMVNVGDLKGNEFPLSYFLDLAYDYDKWGISNMESAGEYTKQWISQQFDSLEDALRKKIGEVLTKSVFLLGRCRPEALNSHTYHAAHFREADYLLQEALALREMSKQTAQALAKSEKAAAYYSMIDYPVQSGMNLLLMQLYAGKNEHYARQGKVVANAYRDLLKEAMEEDRRLLEEFGKAFGGKWKGMELESHIGFTKWNEDGCRYPLQMTVTPFSKPRLLVSRSDEEDIAVKNYGTPSKIVVEDFLYKGNTEVVLEVANDGTGSFICTVEKTENCDWLEISWERKEVATQEYLRLTCREERLPDKEQVCAFYLTDQDATVAVEVHGRKQKTEGLPFMTFLENKGVVAIDAAHYAAIENTSEGEWKTLGPFYGRTGSGIKAFPITRDFVPENAPTAVYRIFMEEAGEYTLEIQSTPVNPSHSEKRLYYGIAVNDGELMTLASVSETYEGGDPENTEWCFGVLNQIRKNKITVRLKEGVNEVRLKALEAGFIPERLLLYKKPPKRSFLGPGESFFVRK